MTFPYGNCEVGMRIHIHPNSKRDRSFKSLFETSTNYFPINSSSQPLSPTRSFATVPNGSA